MNPILNKIGITNQGTQTIQRIKQAYQMAKAMSNPEQALMQMMGDSQMMEVLRLVRENNGDAEATFYKLAKQKGVDPEQILNELTR